MKNATQTANELQEAIIKKCLDCCGYCPEADNNLTKEDFREADHERKNCIVTTCALYNYRLNKPKVKRQMNLSDEERERRRERMRQIKKGV
jgi:hypothetical protein